MPQKIAKFLAGIVALGVLGGVGIHLGGGAKRAEHEIAAAARAKLSVEHPWVGIGSSGQRLNLTGTPPSADAARSAVDAATSAIGRGGVISGGVTVVAADFAEPPPPVFRAAWRAVLRDDKLTITGDVPDASARDLIAAEVADAFAGIDFEDASGAEQAAAPDWTGATLLALRALAHLNDGAILAEDGRFRVEGVAADAAIAEGARRTLEGATGQYQIDSDIAVASPRAEVATTIEEVIARELANAPPEDFSACQREVERVLGQQSITFNSASADLPQSANRIITDLAAAVAPCPSAAIQIDGHTDATGLAADNRALSEQRAQAVAQALRNAGVDDLRLRAFGYADSRPIASNGTAAGRSQNRRIEIRLSAEGTEIE